jgi:hypothetical protein
LSYAAVFGYNVSIKNIRQHFAGTGNPVVGNYGVSVLAPFIRTYSYHPFDVVGHQSHCHSPLYQ